MAPSSGLVVTLERVIEFAGITSACRDESVGQSPYADGAKEKRRERDAPGAVQFGAGVLGELGGQGGGFGAGGGPAIVTPSGRCVGWRRGVIREDLAVHRGFTRPSVR